METMKAIDELAWVFMEEGKEKQAANEIGGLEIQNAEDLWHEALSFYRSTDGEVGGGSPHRSKSAISVHIKTASVGC